MNASVIELEGSVHQRVQKLLPWLAVGQLADTEEKLVREHIDVCQECREDLAWQRKLRMVQPAAGAAPDMEGALARLLPELEPRARAANAGWMRWALAAQLLLIAGLGARLAMQPEPQYRLLGAPEVLAPNMVVVFRADASERELRTVLRANGATVVRGPTATNAWLLNVAPAGLGQALTNIRASEAVTMAEPLQGAQ
ncbi:MAG: zf-HC2 domain-containing protein [Pseudomonadota bacterium]